MKIFSLILLLSVTLHADEGGDNKRAILMSSINNSTCNGIENQNLSRGIKPDVEIFFEAAKKHCLATIVKPMMTDSTPLDARRLFFKALEKAEIKYMNFMNTDYIPKMKNTSMNNDEVSGTGVTVGVFESYSKAACNATKLPELRTSDMCKNLPMIQALDNKLQKIYTEKEAEAKNNHVGACMARPNPDCVHKIMTQPISNPRAQWVWHIAQDYQLVQIVDGFAVFSDSKNPNNDLIAFEKSSLHGSRPLTKFDDIPTSTEYRCASFISEGEAATEDGFSRHILRYKAVDCPTTRAVSSKSK